MKLTVVGSDYIKVDEKNVGSFVNIPRVHLIELGFEDPTMEKINEVMKLYPKTNRFVVCDNVRIYNSLLKNTTKKYYVKNMPGVGIITFFRKNNKVLLDATILSSEERKIIVDGLLPDILKNVEVIKMFKEDFELCKKYLEPWDGNVIVE